MMAAQRRLPLVALHLDSWNALRLCAPLITMMVIASPADLIKVRMQADGLIASRGLQPRYTGLFDALKKIIHAEGFLGLWKGVSANVQRAFLLLL